MQTVVIFGGTGFIGTHLAQFLSNLAHVEKIYLADIGQPRNTVYTSVLQQGLRTGKIVFIHQDVRKQIDSAKFPHKVDVIFNLAAVHREPGHEAREYFETNLAGAENVCQWAETIGCRLIVFTSSISPYGPSEEKKVETTLPVPETPYGSSKLAAEKIHLAWQAAGAERQLLIMRPGVVFGPGEGGNVTRLIQSIVKGFFVYMGNKETKKAAGYVKELCNVMLFGIELLQERSLPYLLLNFSVDPIPSMQDMVQVISKVAGVSRKPLSLPRSLLMGISYQIHVIAKVLKIEQPINPVRVRKMFRSTHVEAEALRKLGYLPRYTLESSFEDWKRDLPADFLK